MFDRRVIQNAFALYASAFGNYLLPLITIPYLARVLGPDTWGVILFVQAIGLYLVLVVDYSFELAGTRQVAQNAEDRELLGEITGGIIGARLTLAAIAIAMLTLGQVFLPALRDTGELLWLGVGFYVFVALRPFWFFLGIEKVRAFLAVELSLKFAAVGAIILFVNAPGDAWIVLASQGVAAALAFVVGMAMVYRRVPMRLPSISRTTHALRDGWNLFLLRMSGSTVTMGNTIILGFVAPSIYVGFFAGAERINRLLVSMMYPLLLALFPRATGLASENRDAAARLARTCTVATVAVAAVGAAILYLLAPMIIRITLGAGYEEAARTLRILLFLLPITGPTIALSINWMIPSGLDGLLTKISLIGTLIHLPLAVILGSQYQHIGIAYAVVVTESFILCTLLATLSVRKLGPFRFNVSASPAESSASS